MRRTEQGGIIFRFLGLLFFLVIFALLYMFRYPLMRFAGEMWVVNETPAASDAIVVLGDDNYEGDRAAHAAELYRQGLAPVVVASGRMLRPQAGMAELLAHDLQHDGVPAASIAESSYSDDSILAEADSVRNLAESKGWKRILLVTSNYDTRRARFAFQHELPADVTIHLSAAADREFAPTEWWQTTTGGKIFLTSVANYLALRFEAPER